MIESELVSAKPQSPPIVDAIDATLQTIERRFRYYRNLVIGVSLSIVVSIGAAFIAGGALPLLGLALTVPLVAGFVYLDARLVSRWIESVSALRETRGLDVAAFEETIAQLKYIPQAPLRAMLDALRRANSIGPTTS